MKIICPNEKRTEHKTFMLRDLDMGEVSSILAFRKEILTQFGDGLIDAILISDSTKELSEYGLETITISMN